MFALSGRLEVHLDNVSLPVGNGVEKIKELSLEVMSVIKKRIVFKSAFLGLSH